MKTSAEYEALREEYARQAFWARFWALALYGAALGLALVALWRWSAP